jgi:uncharacterized RDD family membrane protein YckC
MNDRTWAPSESDFVEGVIFRRCVAWFVDLALIGLLGFVLWLAMAAVGVLTLGLGFGLMALLPIVPFLYHFLSLLSTPSATPGQRLLGLTVRRDDDLGPPTALQALISVLVYYVTLATSGLLLLVALFTVRKRTLHDILSGLVVVRVRAMEALTAPPGYGNISAGPGAR